MNKTDSKVLKVLVEHQDRWRTVKLSMDELSEQTLLHRKTISESVKRLSDLGLISVERTKRNYGRLSYNVYTILQSVQKVTWSPSNKMQSVQKVTSTAGQVNLQVVTGKPGKCDKKNTNTSYLYSFVGASAHEEGKMVNRWSEDDGQIGFGSLELDTPKPEKVAKVPATRGQRPQEEWTARDVASEFASRIYDSIRGIPGMVNTKTLSIALAQNRKKFGITAAVEMRLMDKFFADNRNLTAVKKYPKGAAGQFLNFITNNITSVSAVTIEQSAAMQEEQPSLYASDGRRFDKSIVGRAALERYEEKLKAKQNEVRPA